MVEHGNDDLETERSTRGPLERYEIKTSVTGDTLNLQEGTERVNEVKSHTCRSTV